MDKNTDNYIGMKLDGRYELIERIGSGGMAEIYKANDTAEDRIVAVKILKNEYAGSEEFLRRFRNESKAIALLSHSNIVKISDVGFTESVQFIVMEYIDGITLIEYIEKHGVLKWKEALGFAHQILKALQHAHDRGIVHRDVKSQNVMLLRDGTVKVMDFGIARFNREIDKTMSEKAIGSVHYISPEQARGDTTDEKSDLYSVGIMLYEMLTGVKPFDGTDALAIALMHTNTNPKPPSQVNAAIPKGLEEITLRAMQKDPSKRYQTAGEMINDMREFAKNPSIIFEYRYAQPEQPLNAKTPIAKPSLAAADNFRPDDEESKDNDGELDEFDEYEDDEVIERRSPLLPILFAVASAVVIVAAVLITMIILDTTGGGEGGIFGGKKRTMPKLIGMQYDAVKKDYDWLQLEPTSEISDTYKKGTIMKQNVAEGRKINPEKVVVKVIVSKGKETLRVPVYQTTEQGNDVFNDLNSRGFFARKMEVYDDEIPLGFFIRTDPVADTECELGDEVKVYISRGSEADLFTTKVPDLFNLSENEAQLRAKEYRVTLTVVHQESTEEQRGRVISQTPPLDTVVDNDSVVEVVVGTGPAAPVMKPVSIGFKTGAWTGVYEITYFIDGELQPDLTKNLDIGVTGEIVWEFEGESGTHVYSIRVKNGVTGKEGLLTSYEVNFDEETPAKTLREENLNIFAEINTPNPTATTEAANTASTQSQQR